MEKLFVSDPYMKEFEATVLEVADNQIVLDRTCLYPESGGQVGDTGYIDDFRVVDTKYGADRKTIVHVVSGECNLHEGYRVQCRIDWDRRYRIMRLHAASHVMEHFLFKAFGNLRLVGSHVNERHDSSTYECPDRLPAEKLLEVNRLVNEYTSRGYAIERWPDENNPDYLYWKAGEIEMPCGGTHPKSLGEIGPVTIKRETGGRNREKVLTKLQDQC